MAKILVVNDDGPETPWFDSFLLRVRETGHDVFSVVPIVQQSWRSKCVSRGNPVTVKRKMIAGVESWLVSGTPADCTNIGVFHLVGEDVDLVVSGPNLGHNVGRGSILSSGTIGAALEGAILGYPSLAISYPYFQTYEGKDFRVNHDVAVRLILKVLEHGLPRGVDLLNVNIPEGVKPDSPLRFTVPWEDNYGSLFTRLSDGSFRHTGGLRPSSVVGYPEDSDVGVIMRREVSVVGLKAGYQTVVVHDW